MNTRNIINNEEGSAIILAVVLLLVVTVIGISAINTTTTEIKIYQNEKIYQKNFYQAEASAYEAAQRIEQEINTDQLIPDISGYDWMNDDVIDDTVNLSTLSASGDWTVFGFANSGSGGYSDPSLIDPNTASYFSIAKGVKSGNSLDIGSSRLYSFAAYGLSEINNGKVLIEIGYLRRF